MAQSEQNVGKTDDLVSIAGGTHIPTNVGVAARWAALVGDRLVPMPRRRLAASDILFQASAKESDVLIRDFNGPNDIGFDPDTIVDLAEGNVFQVSSQCAHIGQPQPQSKSKLAFVVDDRWEIVTRETQTVASLRGLFELRDDMDLLRDYESPNDEVLEDGKSLRFVDGPVFLTRPSAERELTIIVNARPRDWTGRTISYEQVIPLAFNPVRTEPFILYTVVYSRGPSANPEGELISGGVVQIKNRMVFLVTETDRS